jgi:alpha-tubulin suppressor-like RCC1 family protein
MHNRLGFFVRASFGKFLSLALFTLPALSAFAQSTFTLNFDSIDTTSGRASGAPVTNYLAGYGITVSGQTAGTQLAIMAANQFYGGGVIVAPSAPNIFTQMDVNAAISFTLNFSQPVSNVSLVRAAVTVPSSMPQWTATALDAVGATLGTTGENSYWGTEAAQTYNLNYTGIKAVRFDSNGNGSAAFSAVVIDNLSFTAPPPSITTQPQSQSVAVGANVTFTVVAPGTPAPTYQWKKGGTDIANATDASLVLNNVQAGDAGSYTVVVSNGVGTPATSDAAVLTVTPFAGGAVVAWGSITTVPGGLSGVTAIAGGGGFIVALRNDGTVMAWGSIAPVPAGLSGVKAIAAGYYHAVALRKDGTVVAWGGNEYGQATVPDGLSGVTAIAAGGEHTVALKSDGTVVAWGSNYAGATTVPTGLSGVTAISANCGDTAALKSDGTVVAWGYNYDGETNVPTGLSGVTAIAVGGNHMAALKSDGTVVTWGSNNNGQMAIPAGLNGVTAIAAGAYFTVALRSDGTVVAWGNNYYSQTTVPACVSGVIAVAAGYDFTVAIVPTGAAFVPSFTTQPQAQTAIAGSSATFTVAVTGTPAPALQWRKGGASISGATNASYTIANAQTSDAGSYDVVATNPACTVLSNIALLRVTAVTPGTVVAWGNNSYGQSTIPADLSHVRAIAAGWYHTVALKSDGTVVEWGDNGSGQTTVPAGLNGVIAIAACGSYTAALKSDGTVVAWGENFYDQTTMPAGLSGVTAIAAGGHHTVALKSDGTVVEWGEPLWGEAIKPAGLNGVIAIAAGSEHTVALKSDGTVVAWGENYNGQTTVPAGLSGVTAIAAGSEHTVALKSDGTVVAWGSNHAGETTVPSGLSGVIAIAAGSEHTVALKSDGTVVAWGWNYNGQTTVPDGLSNVTAVAAGMYHTVALLGPVAPMAAPTITAQPASVGVNAGQNAVFTLAAAGTPTLGYRWQGSTDGGVTWSNLAETAPYSGVTTATLTVSAPTAVLSHAQFRCMVSNTAGSVPSNAALLRVAPGAIGFSGSDDFSTSANWSAPTLPTGNARLAFANSRLEYTVGSPAEDDSALREWTANVGSYTHDWAVQVDVHLATMSLGTGQYANLNLAIVNAADAHQSFGQMDAMDIAIDRYGNGGTTVHDFEGNLVGNGNRIPTAGLIEVPNSSTDATLRISFNSATKELTSWFDADGAANGYSWTLLQRVNIGTGTYTWGMTDSSTFAVVLVGGSGSVALSSGQGWFDNFLATEQAAPAITTQPQSQSVAVGANVTFTVVATGTPAPTYQWKKGGTDITNATNASLVLNNVQAADAGSYTVVVSNGVGTPATSDAAVLTVNRLAQTISFGSLPDKQVGDAPFTLSATASSGLAVSYTSSNPGVATVSGAMVTITGAGSTSITASQTGDATYLPAANVDQTLNVAGIPPTITTQPVSVTVNVTSNATFSVMATGTEPLSYQWQVSTDNGSNWGNLANAGAYSGVNLVTLTVSTSSGLNGYQYRCVVSNGVSPDATSSAATLTVNDAAPTNLTYSANTAVYTQGQAITNNAPSSSGGAVVSYSVSPSLPTGLSLNAGTGVISGTPTAITATASYIVTAANSGGSTTASLSINVNAAPTWATFYVSPDGNQIAPYSSLANATRSIQTTVDLAAAGDEVVVAAGTYTLTAPIQIAKGITVRSASGAAVTTVDGNNATRCFAVSHADAIVDGFTITHGRDANFGGGVAFGDLYSPAAGGLVRNCIIKNNDGGQYGGGVWINGAGTLRNCLIVNNQASINYGGGVALWKGGVVENCTVSGNQAFRGGGLMAISDSNGTTPVIRNTIIYGNSASSEYADANISWSWGGGTYTNNCASANSSSAPLPGAGNITSDPLFVNAAAGNYRLQAGSPCIDTGGNLSWTGTAVDLDGQPRVSNGTVDMGAYESVAASAPPAITSGTTATATVGTAFNFQVTASNSPTSFALTGTLPAGLSFTTATGVIGGTPTVTGAFPVTLTASNAGGTGPTFTLTITVNVAEAGSTVLVEDGFSGLAGAPTDAAKFEWDGQVTLTGSGQLYLLTQTVQTSWLRSKAGAAPSAGETLVLQMRAAAYAEDWTPGVYGDQQPRGLRVGSDANNAVEFYSASTTSLGLRVRKDGVESQEIYPLPARVDAMHDYEITVTTTSVVFKVDGVVAGTFTSNIPTGVLNVYVDTDDGGGVGNVPVSIESLSLTLTGNQVAGIPPGITTQPQSQTVSAGANVTFTVAATGTPAPTYQWKKGGTDIANATNASLVLNNVQAAAAGSYTVVASNGVGSPATSDVAVLTITRLAQTICFAVLPDQRGDAAPFTLSATASSGLPVGYTSSNPAVATVSGNTVTITGVGRTTITASQVGDARYLPAPNVTEGLRVTAMPGTVVAWGQIYAGSSTFVDVTVPSDLGKATAIAAGNYPVVVVKEDGTVATWGYNGYGQMNVPAGLANVTAVAAGTCHTLALKQDGTVVAWGSNSAGQSAIPAGLSNVIAIAAGDMFSVALKSDGTVIAWGFNNSGQTNVPADLVNVTAIAAGGEYALALKSDGTVVAWGHNDFGQTNVPASLSNVTAIAAGQYHALAVKSDGTVIAWGLNNSGQATVPADLTNVTTVAAGIRHTVALKSNGTVVAWGQWYINGSTIVDVTVPAGLSNVTAIATSNYNIVALVSMVSPSITTQPASVTVTAGQNAVFTVAALGTPVPAYRWQGSTDGGVTWSDLGDFAPYSGAATATLTVNEAATALSRSQFRCVVTNTAGSVTSSAALLRVAPVVTGFSGSDNFPTYDNWSAPTIPAGNGRLAIAYSRLEYTVGSPTDDDSALREWTANVGSYTHDWAVQVHVHLATMTLTGSQYANLNLAVVKAADALNSFGQMNVMDVAIDRYASGGGTVHNFEGNLIGNGNRIPTTGLIEVPSSATDATLRISFNSTTKELTSWFEADGAYSWTLLQTVNIGTGTYAWNMTDSGTFAVMLVGGSGGATLSSGQAYFDHFLATEQTGPAITTQPVSQAAVAGTSVTFTVAASGAASPTYQWQKNGTAIDGATSATLTIGNVQLADTGYYTVVVTSGTAGTTSAAATLALPSFPIATSGSGLMSIGAAFGGTNFLVGIQGGSTAGSAPDEHDAITAQLVSPTGALVGSRISAGSFGGASNVAFDGTNYFMVWQSAGDTGVPTTDRLMGAFVSPSGAAGSPFMFPRSATDSASQDIAGLAFDGTRYLVVYVDGTATPCRLCGRFVSPSGTVGEEFVLATNAAQSLQSVAWNGSTYLVAWPAHIGDNQNIVQGRLVSPAGVLSDVITISGNISVDQNPLSVATDGTSFLVAWNYRSSAGLPWDLRGRIITPIGGLAGSVFIIAGAPADPAFPGLAFDGTNYLVTWTDLSAAVNGDVSGRYVSAAGTPLGSSFGIALGGNKGIASVVFGGGKCLVFWTDGVGGMGDEFRGTALRGMFLTSGGTTPTAPTITTQPANQLANIGQTATFTVVATGTPTPTNQWQRQASGTTGFVALANGGSYSGVATATLTVSGVTLAMSGDQFRCVASNGVSPNATSSAATLTVLIYHSADTNQDGRLSLVELTRVIELYNTRNGTVRAGRYKVQAGTEDGFAQDTVATANQTLIQYHSADSNRDGQIGLSELTRVIELYNTRVGTTRTGQYHVQAGTEDGFAPGP